jgi:hypothetical protein
LLIDNSHKDLVCGLGGFLPPTSKDNMVLRTFCIEIQKPVNVSLGDIMNSIRLWLDTHKIQPVEFTSRPSEGGAVTLVICFGTEEEANLFERDFRSGQN